MDIPGSVKCQNAKCPENGVEKTVIDEPIDDIVICGSCGEQCS